MKTKLTIKNFKRVDEEIVFENFGFINYFVGENGSGKTSILNAISFLKDSINSRHFFGATSTVNLEINIHNQYLYWNEEDPNKVEHRGNLNPNIYLLASNSSNEKGANGIAEQGKPHDRIHAGSKIALDQLNAFLKEIGHSELTAKKYVDQSAPFNQDNGRLIYETENSTITPSHLADGLTVLFNFRTKLNIWLTKLNLSRTPNLIIIEEPENNLHPDLQKEIPGLLNDIHAQLKPEIAEQTFFFISTHSPFIISSSSKYHSQKVFPIQNGKPLIINFNNHSWTESNRSIGYDGEKCAYVVSKMLGADISDIGYPENYCILEEYSLQIILDFARDKGIIKNIQFVSASGVSKSVDLSETIYEIEKLNTLIKCSPYYFDKYLMIIDSMKDIDDDKLKGRLDRIKKRLNGRFIELSLLSLEDYYSNIDAELKKAVKDELLKEKERNKGVCKAKYAELISKKIVDTETFSKLFNNELDFLLRENN